LAKFGESLNIKSIMEETNRKAKEEKNRVFANPSILREFVPFDVEEVYSPSSLSGLFRIAVSRYY
jgi:hypothetical protein